jgi:hypothetical protein
MAGSEICSIVDIVEDILNNGSLTKQDVEELDKFIGQDTSIDILVELLLIPQSLDWKLVDPSLSDLIYRCIEALYFPDGKITSIIEMEIIDLFDPEDTLSPIEKEVLQRIGMKEHGKVLQYFLDTNMI